MRFSRLVLRSTLRLLAPILFLLLALGPVAEAAEVRVHVPGFQFDPIQEGEPELPAVARADSSGPQLRLVQFQGPVEQSRLDSLAAAGARPLQYYPHDTYLVWSSEAAMASLESQEAVRWQGLFHPAYKIGQSLKGKAASQTTSEDVDVIFYNDGDIRGTLDALAALGAVITGSFPAQPDKAFWNAVVQLPTSAISSVARLSTVVWFGVRGPGPQLEDEMTSQIVAGNHPGGVPVTGYLPHLASLGVDGTGVIWAIGDTGVDYDHPDLGPRIVGGFSSGSCDPAGQPGSDCGGARGHGTHVAGIVGGDASGAFADGDGFLYGLGVAPEVEFFALDVFTGSDPYQEYSRQAFLAGAAGTNNSWTSGGINHGYLAVERTYDFMVRDADFTSLGVAEPHMVVFSAGNSGPSGSTLTAPKEAKNVIVTAGTQNYRTTNNIEAMYNSSSRGPAVDGRYVPTIAAPGQTVISARNDLGGSCTSSVVGGTNNLYSFCSGTSMAAPQASGALALITQWWRGLSGGADPSPAMAKALLINSAVPVGSTAAIPNFDVGWGRINVTEAVQPSAPRVYEDQTVVLDGSGQQWILDVNVANPVLPLKVTLVWSDAPAALGANPTLVNDLDMVVEVGGTSYLGNEFSGGWSQAGGAADALNNHENVFVQAPGSGMVTITVAATAINGDGVPIFGDTTDQDFALVCSNCVLATESIFADGFESGDTSAWSLVVP
ncbi:MAG: S8 family serine peptidase [Deltaproteobacteria bacterium]|nr:S8 family serine peptidase [Deltaproteobacteria bacterium]